MTLFTDEMLDFEFGVFTVVLSILGVVLSCSAMPPIPRKENSRYTFRPDIIAFFCIGGILEFVHIVDFCENVTVDKPMLAIVNLCQLVMIPAQMYFIVTRINEQGELIGKWRKRIATIVQVLIILLDFIMWNMALLLETYLANNHDAETPFGNIFGSLTAIVFDLSFLFALEFYLLSCMLLAEIFLESLNHPMNITLQQLGYGTINSS